MKKFNYKGFSAVEALLLLVILGVIGGVGWYVLSQNNKSSQTSTKANGPVATDNNPTSKETFTLASEKVAFETPDGWTKDGVGCEKTSPMFNEQELVDSAALQPKGKPKYEKGKGYFNVNICVFENKDTLTPKDWFGKVNGHPSDKDITSSEAINGNDAYYVKFVAGEHGYDDISYVISAKNKLIYIQARTYENSEGDPTDSGQVGDFRKYEPDVKDLAYSVEIK